MALNILNSPCAAETIINNYIETAEINATTFRCRTTIADTAHATRTRRRHRRRDVDAAPGGSRSD
jgi:hypothetical protein